jgi:hypothetical protein
MANKFTSRSQTLNMVERIDIRITENQKQKLEEYAVKYNIKVSDIIRESITIWLNLNAEKRG